MKDTAFVSPALGTTVLSDDQPAAGRRTEFERPGGIDRLAGERDENLLRPDGNGVVAILPALITVSVGFVVLLGWALRVQWLIRVMPGLATMKANTALAFVLIGTSLGLLTARPRRRWTFFFARAAAIGTILIGGLTLLEYALGSNLGIDELLTKSGDLQNRFPGRASPATVSCIFCVGNALVLLPARRRVARILVQCLSLAVILIAGLAVVGYLYGVESLYKVRPYSSMALHTSVTMIIAVAGILMSQPDFGLTAPLRSKNAGGTLARRLLPIVVCAPLMLGWLRLKGEHLGWYGLEFGVALFAVSNIVVLSACVWNSACTLNRLDVQQSRAQKQLEQQRAGKRFRGLLESAPDAMVIVDRQGQIVLVNSQTERLFGYRREELLGQTVEILMPQRLRLNHPAYRDAYFANPRPRGMAMDAELFGRRKDGSEFPAEVSLGPLENEDGILVCSAIRDITQRKQAEQEARYRLEQEKLAEHRTELARVLRLNTMGEMAAGIAHELNQPLSAIANYAKGCVRRLDTGRAEPTGIVEALKSIASEAMRASEIIRSLKRYVKKCEPQRTLVDMNSIVQTATQIVVGEARQHGVDLNLCCSGELPMVSADPIQLEQVLVNLLANGIDALEHRGAGRQLTVETCQTTGGDVEVLVADNGCGLPADYEHKIFESFFTTKDHGLGMGLAISRSMIEAHGGRLSAQDNDQGGATFRFTLPCHSELSHAL